MPEPQWTSTPTEAPPTRTLDLRRVGNQPRVGVALNDTPIGTRVHFWRGRTRPCLGLEHCEACQDGRSSKWVGYLALYDPLTRDVWIQEFTAKASEGIHEGTTQFRTLRGHWIKLWRTRPTMNAPMAAQVHTKMEPPEQLPPAPNIIEHLYRIWQFDPATTTTETTTDQLHQRITPADNPRRNGQPTSA